MHLNAGKQLFRTSAILSSKPQVSIAISFFVHKKIKEDYQRQMALSSRWRSSDKITVNRRVSLELRSFTVGGK
jgi:hypothetical protein